MAKTPLFFLTLNNLRIDAVDMHCSKNAELFTSYPLFDMLALIIWLLLVATLIYLGDKKLLRF